jgi:hypothetical protein
MKTLVKHTPILVILIWVVLALIISLTSCSKDKLTAVSDRQVQPVELQKIALSGPVIDMMLNAYSSLDPGTSYKLTMDRNLVESFRITQNENMKWHFDNLMAGTHRINIYTAVTNNMYTGFCNFRFTINNGTESKSVITTKIDQDNYAFDLSIE